MKPYYHYQCDPIHGWSHLRTPVAEGVAVIEGLRGYTTGYAIPQFVIDGPRGGGKIQINLNCVVDASPGRVTLRNFEGDIFEYPDPTPIPAADREAVFQQALSPSG